MQRDEVSIAAARYSKPLTQNLPPDMAYTGLSPTNIVHHQLQVKLDHLKPLSKRLTTRLVLVKRALYRKQKNKRGEKKGPARARVVSHRIARVCGPASRLTNLAIAATISVD